MSNTIRVFVPVGNVQAPGTRDAMLARRRSGPRLVVGMLDNHKHNSDKVLDRLQHRLSERYGDARFVRVKKPEAGKPAQAKMLEDLAAQCDAVVNGIGDWGSCTSWSLHDSVELEKRGVATATIVTSGFSSAAEAHRRLLKRPQLPYFVVPHPIVSMTDDELFASADAIFDQIASIIAGSEELPKPSNS